MAAAVADHKAEASHPGAGPFTPARKVVLVSIDGWGLTGPAAGNAIVNARTPNMTALTKDHLFAELDASGLAVGLPAGVMGNSEVGHLTMGCGRVDFQDLVRISLSIEDGSLYSNPRLQAAFEHAKSKSGGRLHLLGLVSDGGVHSHIDHVQALLDYAKRAGVPNTYLHFFGDGRDTAPSSGVKYVEQIMDYMAKIGYGKLATIVGRYYAMDRDKRWERIQIAYEALTSGVGAPETKGDSKAAVVAAVQERYAAKETDEFLKPILINKEGLIRDNDTVLFFDYRSDRMRQIVETFGVKQNFALSAGATAPKGLHIAQMTQYNAAFPFPVLFPPQSMANVLSEWVSKHGWAQFHTAETEKYAHVTFFFNGNVESAFPREDRCLVPSPKVATYDLAPEMAMAAVGQKVIAAMESKAPEYPFVMCNLAAPDMVGHTGVYAATVTACEACDQVIGQIWDAAKRLGFTLVITADHGNAEEMHDSAGKPKTSHTTNFVPLIIAADPKLALSRAISRPKGGLKDVAPTVCDLLGIAVPKEMTGSSMLAAAAAAAAAPGAAAK